MGKLAGIARLASYPASRLLERPSALPLNLTLSVTYACSSRCKTCEVWKKRADNLRLDEYERIFASLGGSISWVTISGGDQFSRADLPEIVRLVRERLRPEIINLPMNGLLKQRIETLLPEIAFHSRGLQLILNLSIDDLGERHDAIRGRPGAFERVTDTLRYIKRLKRRFPHIVLGIHTVVSRFNAERFPEIVESLRAFEPDSLISEVAENRVELGTIERDISPTADQYAAAVDHLIQGILAKRSRHPIGRLVESLRLEYYDLVKQTLRELRQPIPCYAGWASAHIAPDGELWGCCVRAESFGNLRDHGYDFRAVWSSERAAAFRRSVINRECACPLASAAYTNIALSPARLLRVAANYLSLPRLP
ncbi:MAG TPA: radical SAM protein [Myxococcales bacterium]|jgi:MoaA/NifB/PqqE/SkfB family radical SAM enzyme|nr:radical SAM protein [Myxococcales bacterium]